MRELFTLLTAKVRLVEEIALMHSCGPYPAARRQAENWRFRRIFNELIVSAAATRDELRARPSRRIEHVLHPLEADSEPFAHRRHYVIRCREPQIGFGLPAGGIGITAELKREPTGCKFRAQERLRWSFVTQLGDNRKRCLS